MVTGLPSQLLQTPVETRRIPFSKAPFCSPNCPLPQREFGFHLGQGSIFALLPKSLGIKQVIERMPGVFLGRLFQQLQRLVAVTDAIGPSRALR